MRLSELLFRLAIILASALTSEAQESIPVPPESAAIPVHREELLSPLNDGESGTLWSSDDVPEAIDKSEQADIMQVPPVKETNHPAFPVAVGDSNAIDTTRKLQTNKAPGTNVIDIGPIDLPAILLLVFMTAAIGVGLSCLHAIDTPVAFESKTLAINKEY